MPRRHDVISQGPGPGRDSAESADRESLNTNTQVDMRLEGFATHPIHPRRRRAVPQPLGETFDGFGRPDRQHFDAAIRKIPRMAAYAERQRLRTGVCAECDALDMTADIEQRRHSIGRHAYRPGATWASMTAARSAPVTGPMNSFAILPSGAMT